MSDLFGDATKGASTLWDSASDAAGGLWNTASDVVSKLAELPGRVWDSRGSNLGGRPGPDEADPDKIRERLATPERAQIDRTTPERAAQDAADEASYKKSQQKLFEEATQRWRSKDDLRKSRVTNASTDAERRSLPLPAPRPNPRDYGL